MRNPPPRDIRPFASDPDAEEINANGLISRVAFGYIHFDPTCNELRWRCRRNKAHRGRVPPRFRPGDLVLMLATINGAMPVRLDCWAREDERYDYWTFHEPKEVAICHTFDAWCPPPGLARWRRPEDSIASEVEAEVAPPGEPVEETDE